MEDKNSLFTEITAEEAASTNGGGWKQWWEGTRNTRNYINTVSNFAKGAVTIPIGIAISIAQKQLYSSGHSA